MSSIFTKLFDAHYRYRHELYSARRISHKDFIQSLKAFSKHSSVIDLKEIGKSVANRSINLVKIGNGPRRILFWSQMHGNEATATMALMDIFSFFTKQDEFDVMRRALMDSFSLYFIPVLNPDGMEVFERRNAIGIDMNRDALQLTSPESKLLKAICDEIKPEFGFNLHDQDIHYTVGKGPLPATISFLAPPIDELKTVNNTRLKAMQLIGLLHEGLQALIPGQVAKYTDEFEPRAFGDNVQMWGTSTVLVESGGFSGDIEKQEIRKLNFVLLLAALVGINNDKYLNYHQEYYHKIPFNGKFLFDLLLRSVTVEIQEKEFLLDIGINREEINLNEEYSFYNKGIVEDVGDLSIYFGFEEVDCVGLKLVMGKCYDGLQSSDELDLGRVIGLIKDGFTTVAVANKPKQHYIELPTNTVSGVYKSKSGLEPGADADFLLVNNSEVKKAIINGFVLSVEEPEGFKGHGRCQ